MHFANSLSYSIFKHFSNTFNFKDHFCFQGLTKTTNFKTRTTNFRNWIQGLQRIFKDRRIAANTNSTIRQCNPKPQYCDRLIWIIFVLIHPVLKTLWHCHTSTPFFPDWQLVAVLLPSSWLLILDVQCRSSFSSLFRVSTLLCPSPSVELVSAE